MTEQELDALVRDHANKLAALWPDKAADPITTLRAQLAAESMVVESMARGAVQAAIKLATETARANRAEAALAAQIEVDAGIARSRHEENEILRATWATPMLTTLADVSDEIRAQPHDRTALGAAIRAAKVEALRKAETATLGLATGRECQLAIRALIAQEGGE